MKEIWKPMTGYHDIRGDRLMVSNTGKIKSCITGRILKTYVSGRGYESLRFTLDGGKKTITIHRAVAIAFIPNPNNYAEINHKDGNKLSNNFSNLEWCTRSQNERHKFDTGLYDPSRISGEHNGNHKLTVENVKYIREHFQRKSKEFGAIAMCQKFNVNRKTITDVVNGKIWKNV